MGTFSDEINSNMRIDDDESIHSLQSLVSSDKPIHCLEQRDGVPSNVCLQSTQNCQDQISSSTRMSIIACSSPEIKALVAPLPDSIRYEHQRSVSNLSFCPEDLTRNGSYDRCSVRRTQKGHSSLPVVSPTFSSDRENIEKNCKKTIKDYEQDSSIRGSYCSGDRFNFDDESITMKLDFLHLGETDGIRSKSKSLSGATFNASPSCSQAFMSQNTTIKHVQWNHVQQKPLEHQEHFFMRRSTKHRRVSYDNLPDMSKVLCQPGEIFTKGS